MIPNYQITGQSVTPQEIVDVVPEQEASDRAIQASEERYLQQLEKNNADKVRNTEKMYEGLAELSGTFADIIKKKQQKHREDREAQIKLDILTRGVSPELEATFRGDRDQLFEDDLATQEFASKYEAETGDSITAQEFRKMAGWEKYIVAEQYALQKAKGYDQFVYDSYETMTIDLVRDGQQVTGLKYADLQDPAEYAALDEKIKFEYARQFAGLNEALVATVVKPEIDKFDEKRRKEQAVRRETAYKIQVKESDDKRIEIGFVTANPEDGHQLAHDWAARYAARNRVSIQAGRIAFKESLVDLVANNKISYAEAMSVVSHEIKARDGSTKTMTSWKEWDGLGEELADANVKSQTAKTEDRNRDIAADVEIIKSLQNPTNEQKTQLMAVYKQKYDGYIPSDIQGALKGHLDDDVAEEMLQESIRYQGGVYDFELANVSTELFNKYKDKLIVAGSSVPGTDDHKKAIEFITTYTNEGSEETFGETDAKSPRWLSLRDNLHELYFTTYKNTLYRNGTKVSTEADADRAAKLAVQQAVGDPNTLNRMMSIDFTDDGDETYNRMMQTSMTESGGGKWRRNKITSNAEVDAGLIAWHNTPLKQSKDLPSYYKDLAMRMGINPVDLANSQLRYLVDEDVQVDEQQEEYNQNILNLIYKFPTREKITRARLEAEGAGEQNAKTSIFNRKALTITDE
jgi:hypothetical protein